MPDKYPNSSLTIDLSKEDGKRLLKRLVDGYNSETETGNLLV